MAFKVAVLGLGYFSKFHLDSWTKNPECEVVAATDLSPGRCAWARSIYDIPVFDNILSVLQSEPDIVDIIAPPEAHKQLVRAVLKTGRTVICQKPFCTSEQDAREVVEICKKVGMDLIIHENFRFQPWHRAIKSTLLDGVLGEVYQAQFLLRPGDGRGRGAYLDRQPSFQKMERFLMQETGVHFVDLFRYFFGEIESVFAETRRLNSVIAGEDAATMIFQHASGVRSIFDGNRLVDHETDNSRRTMGEMQIEGTAGTIRLLGSGEVNLRLFGSNKWTRIELPFTPDDTSFGGGCVAALNRHVVSALKGNQALENKAEDYLHIIEVTDAAYISAQEGRKISTSTGG
ncbi:MAG: Gfo/Idh/MocA family oxidoreductase [Pseudomonadota bacterium]